MTEEKSLINYTKNDFDKYLKDKSVLELIDDLTFLDEIKPYAELSPDEEIGKFLLKKHKELPINTATEFNEFYVLLNNKIGELGDTEKGVEFYLQKRNYLSQIGNLPAQMSKLENIINKGFEELVPSFKAVFNYVWDAVINDNFTMEKEVKASSKKSTEKIKIGEEDVKIGDTGKITEGVEINMIFENYCWTCDLYKQSLKWSLDQEKILGFRINKTKLKECYPEKGDFFIKYGRDFYSSVQEYVDRLQDEFEDSNNSDSFTKEFGLYVKNIINLPVIMNDYAKKKEEQIKKIFSE